MRKLAALLLLSALAPACAVEGVVDGEVEDITPVGGGADGATSTESILDDQWQGFGATCAIPGGELCGGGVDFAVMFPEHEMIQRYLAEERLNHGDDTFRAPILEAVVTRRGGLDSNNPYEESETFDCEADTSGTFCFSRSDSPFAGARSLSDRIFTIYSYSNNSETFELKLKLKPKFSGFIDFEGVEFKLQASWL